MLHLQWTEISLSWNDQNRKKTNESYIEKNPKTNQNGKST